MSYSDEVIYERTTTPPPIDSDTAYTNPVYDERNITHDIYLSYNLKDRERALSLVEAIGKHRRMLKVWSIELDCGRDELVRRKCKAAIDASKCVLACLSSNYSRSFFTMDELNYACHIRKPIFLLLVEPTRSPSSLDQVGTMVSRSVNFFALKYFEQYKGQEFDAWLNDLSDQLSSLDKPDGHIRTLSLDFDAGKSSSSINIRTRMSTVKSVVEFRLDTGAHGRRFNRIYVDDVNQRVLLVESQPATIVSIDLRACLDQENVTRSAIGTCGEHSLDEQVKEIGTVCLNLNTSHDMLVSDVKTQRLFWYTTHLTFVKLFTFKKIGRIYHMDVDVPNKGRLFLSNSTKKRIDVYDLNNGLRIHKQFKRSPTLRNFSPDIIKVKGDFVYAVNRFNFATNLEKMIAKFSQEEMSPYSGASILVFKSTDVDTCLKIIDSCFIWMQPKQLYVDDLMNISFIGMEILKRVRICTSENFKLFKIACENGKVNYCEDLLKTANGISKSINSLSKFGNENWDFVYLFKSDFPFLNDDSMLYVSEEGSLHLIEFY